MGVGGRIPPRIHLPHISRRDADQAQAAVGVWKQRSYAGSALELLVQALQSVGGAHAYPVGLGQVVFGPGGQLQVADLPALERRVEQALCLNGIARVEDASYLASHRDAQHPAVAGCGYADGHQNRTVHHPTGFAHPLIRRGLQVLGPFNAGGFVDQDAKASPAPSRPLASRQA